MLNLKNSSRALLFTALLIGFGCEMYSAGFIKLQGIKGEATEKGFEGWTEISSIQTFSTKEEIEQAKQNGVSPPRRIDGTQTKAFAFTKRIDNISPLLGRRVEDNKRMKTVVVDFEMPDGKQLYMLLWEVTFGAVRKISDTEEEFTLYYEAAQGYGAGSGKKLKAKKRR